MIVLEAMKRELSFESFRRVNDRGGVSCLRDGRLKGCLVAVLGCTIAEALIFPDTE